MQSDQHTNAGGLQGNIIAVDASIIRVLREMAELNLGAPRNAPPSLSAPPPKTAKTCFLTAISGSGSVPCEHAICQTRKRSMFKIQRDRNRQNLTRYQEQLIRKTFPFLELPAEIRNMIYPYTINDVGSGIEKYCAKYYLRLHNSDEPGKERAPAPHRTTPTVFLINRQTYLESISFLQRHSVTFQHGIFELASVNALVSQEVLQKITSLTINDKGHPLLERKILCHSWHGYIRLFDNLVAILSGGHNLKTLTISLLDPNLALHFNQCWQAGWKCGFRDGLNDVLDKMRSIRGVGEVIIEGLPADLARGLKTRMQSKPTYFLDLPAEVRNHIYHYAADWSDVSKQLVRTLAKWTEKDTSPPYPVLTTPTIFLLNRQVYTEAIGILLAKPLNLLCPGDHCMQKQSQVPDLIRFISPITLQQVQHINLVLESWEWMYTLDKLIPVLATKHSLKSLSFTFFDSLKPRFTAATQQLYPDNTLHLSLGALAKIRGLGSVVIPGDLPDCYTEPLAQIMQSAAVVTKLPKMAAERGDGVIVELDDDDDAE